MKEFAAATHPGLKRHHNEDCYGADPELGLWLVADGVGGHAYGEVASSIVQSTVAASYSEGKKLIDAVHSSHRAVLLEIAQRDENLGMGSTVVAFALTDNRYSVIWVGDSRAYLWDGEVLRQLTRDHTHVYDLVDQGRLSSAEAATHPERHVLTQSIGVFDDMELAPGIHDGQLGEGQQILLCSDGLTDELSDTAIAAQMRRNGSTQAQVDGLVNAALAAGGRDNITVVVVGSATGVDHRDDTAQLPERATTQKFAPTATGSSPARKGRAQSFGIAIIGIFVLALITWLKD